MLAAVLLVVAGRECICATPLKETEVYRAGEGGYHTYRIPALITTRSGALLAFCEGRRNSASDTGDIDIMLRRSTDNGATWSPIQRIADMGEDTIGNPTPVLERSTGTIFLLLTSNPGRSAEEQITRNAPGALRTVWLMTSADNGVTWTRPVEITTQVKKPEWTWYATGPGNGIQLRTGRLVVPCDHNTRDNERHSHVIYSDDRGKTWKIGGVAANKTNESAVAEMRNGGLVLNMRSYHGRNRRAVQRSMDGGLSWSPLVLDDALLDPVCQASLISAVRGSKRPNGRLLFSNPAATTRRNMTVRLSRDDGHSWAVSRAMYEGPSGYSSLAALRDGSFGLLYERGEAKPYERIEFARFDTKWLDGK
ncbi:MAG: exo-alpha-sialidase [Acidobacteriaceae bacterium]|nr:exo-alpha-sialidase [Acidobacteriaceae bacterium]